MAPGDSDALARAVVALRERDLDAMGSAGRAALERGYSRDDVVARIEELLERVVSADRG